MGGENAPRRGETLSGSLVINDFLKQNPLEGNILVIIAQAFSSSAQWVLCYTRQNCISSYLPAEVSD